jgi:cellobiose epimerase
MKKSTLLLCYIILILLSCNQAQKEPTSKTATPQAAINDVLDNLILKKWYPRVVDTAFGGYLSNFDYQWQKKESQEKMIVTQARHVWTASKAAEFYPQNKHYPSVAAHGFRFLKDKMWDATDGGFYNLVKQDGQPILENKRIIKQAYGNAFAIYALAAYFKLSGDTSVLNLAKQGFYWLEKHSHDPHAGGYFQFLEKNGSPLKNGLGNTPPKDQNSSIHLMEAFTELYGVWKDDLVRKRLDEMLVLIRDSMTDKRGFLNLFFEQNWAHRSYRDSTEEVRKKNTHLDHVSFGHDIETAWLLIDAANALGKGDDEKTLKMAKQLVDHGLKYGFDKSVGGVYDGGYYFTNQPELVIIKDGKNWWAQVETMNTLLFMAQLYPKDQMDYYGKFLTQWKYIQDYLIDYENGEMYAGGLDKEPKQKTGDKSHIWKGAYHTSRSLMNCSRMLEGRK